MQPSFPHVNVICGQRLKEEGGRLITPGPGCPFYEEINPLYGRIGRKADHGLIGMGVIPLKSLPVDVRHPKFELHGGVVERASIQGENPDPRGLDLMVKEESAWLIRVKRHPVKGVPGDRKSVV